MDGFKNSTKTHYMKGGSCEGYAKGGKVKGAAKISKVMGEFKSGALHSGSKKGPEVTNPKQAVAIALSEARKAGAKIPVKKAGGGRMMNEPISSRPVKIGPTPEERAAKAAAERANRMQALEAREEEKLMRERRDMRKVTPKSREVTTERRMTAQRDVREPMIRNPLMEALTTLPSQRGQMPIRRKHGGLAAMPNKGHKK